MTCLFCMTKLAMAVKEYIMFILHGKTNNGGERI